MHVLLVEDDEIVAGLVEEILGGEGHRVGCVSTPEGAHALLAAEAWDLVVTDSFSAGHDVPDEEELAHLRALTSRVPVVMLTGRTWASKVSASALGVAAILPKPFDLDDLIRAVEATADAPRDGAPPRAPVSPPRAPEHRPSHAV